MSDELPSQDGNVRAVSQDAFWGDTLTLLTKRVEENPTDAASWSNRGMLLTHLQQYEQAERDFGEALRLDPNSVYAISGLGGLLLACRRYSEAIATFDKGVALAPSSADSYYDRGRGYLASGRVSEAITDFTTAIHLDPMGWAPYFWRAMVRLEDSVRDYSGALADVNAFFSVKPDCADVIAQAHAIRAEAYMHLGMYEEAIRDYSAELELTPRNAVAYFERSKAYEMVGENDRALQDRKMGRELSP